MSIVICRLPKAGLGNQLFPLLKALTFAELNGLPIIIIGYHQLKLGPYFRLEKYKRRYNNYFIFQKSVLGEKIDQWRLLRKKHLNKQIEPSVEYVRDKAATIFEYNAIPSWKNYFEGLKEHRNTVIKLLWKNMRADIKEKIERYKSPSIGVHIRMGDFRKLKEGEDFSKVGAVRTSEKYFIDIIENIRKVNGSSLPVSVFTDGYKSEFKELFSLNNLYLVEGNSDIVDMMLLSKSSIIVCSAGSTFSYWAGFLANAPLILHPDHIHDSIRTNEINNNWYEGPWDSTNTLLIDNIINISIN
ncbi:MAG TPA: alpha-1,2-fucosyltransferase [Ferruginibacter sp.]|nr:alpha-1,2-fucosyltransferase [Ferruginibacter sp.]